VAKNREESAKEKLNRVRREKARTSEQRKKLTDYNKVYIAKKRRIDKGEWASDAPTTSEMVGMGLLDKTDQYNTKAYVKAVNDFTQAKHHHQQQRNTSVTVTVIDVDTIAKGTVATTDSSSSNTDNNDADNNDADGNDSKPCTTKSKIVSLLNELGSLHGELKATVKCLNDLACHIEDMLDK